jgi:exosortase A-associated hydrolase 1
MRTLLSFECEGAALGASLDAAAGGNGLLFVTGGTQTRIGSHRLFERLATGLAAEGIPCFRFDRRGVGDSNGTDPDWRGSAADLRAAAAAFRRAAPTLERVIGIGLCDGATALALYGAETGLDGLIMINPWLVETAPGESAPAAIAHHYQERLRSSAGWRKILLGSVSWVKLLKGIGRIAAGSDGRLAGEIAAAVEATGLPVETILASDDGTAVAARHELARPDIRRAVDRPPAVIETSSHTFARPGDFDRLHAAITAALSRM